MLKFTMNTKELKTMIEKGITTINKKAALPTLTKLYFQVDENDTLRVWGTDAEHFIEIRTDNAWNVKPGILGIDIDDIKILTKMSGIITLENISTEKELKINIQCGNKNISIPKYENINVFLPTMDNTEKHILTLNESWALETIVNLATYTGDSNKLFEVFNFNTEHERIEALDGHRIGMRTLENQTILHKNENVMIHRKCLPVFKKIMDKKSDNEIKIYQDKKYIRVEGNNFTYIIKRTEGEYFKINRMLDISDDFHFTPDRENILEVMKYNYDLVKNNSTKKPVVLHSENENLYSYIKTEKYEVFDKLEIKDINMKENLYIGFNPQFLADAFNIVDSENPVCIGTNGKAPLLITGNEYSFLVLPVNVSDDEYSGDFSEHINRNKAA